MARARRTLPALALAWALGCTSSGESPGAIDAPAADVPLALDAPVDARLDAAYFCPDGSVASCPICGPAPATFQCIGGHFPECIDIGCYSACGRPLPPQCVAQCQQCADGCVHCDPTTGQWQTVVLDYCLLQDPCPDAGPPDAP